MRCAPIVALARFRFVLVTEDMAYPPFPLREGGLKGMLFVAVGRALRTTNRNKEKNTLPRPQPKVGGGVPRPRGGVGAICATERAPLVVESAYPQHSPT